MKNKLFYFFFIFITIWKTDVSAQCYLLQDSIIGGDHVQRHTNYRYDMNWRITGSEIIDSAQTTIGQYDTIYYDLSGLADSIVRYNMSMGVPYWSQTTIFTYNGFNQISRIDAYGIRDTIPWTMSHDLYYSGSGTEIFHIALDTGSVTGDPEGLVASFDSIVWSNGNPTSLRLISDFGGGLDTIELIINFDNKNNRKRLEYISGMGGLLEFLAQNNIVSILLENDESLGVAGTEAMLNTYTYNPADEVETMIQHPRIFYQDSSVHQYTYDCVTANPVILNKADFVQIYPNPFENQLVVDLGDLSLENLSLNLSSMDGKIVYTQTNVKQSIIKMEDLGQLPVGVYILTIQNSDQIISKKLIK